LFNHISVKFGRFDFSATVSLMNRLGNYITFLFGSTGEHNLTKNIAVLRTFVSNYPSDATCADNENFV
jgi:hypothetical protein